MFCLEKKLKSSHNDLNKVERQLKNIQKISSKEVQELYEGSNKQIKGWTLKKQPKAKL